MKITVDVSRPQLGFLVAGAAIAAFLFAGIREGNAGTDPRPTRVAVVDVNKVLMTTKAGKASYDKLKKQQDASVAKAKQMDEEISKLDADISSKALTLSEDKLTEMKKQLADKKIAMQRYAQDADREIAESRDRELASLETRVKPVIDSVAKEMGIEAIFNKFESGLVFASDNIDVTDAVVKKFNESSP